MLGLERRFLIVTSSDAELPALLSVSERASLQGVSLDALCAAWKAPFSKGSSAYRGVSKDKRSGKWQAMITLDGQNMRLGNFEQEVDAAKAYDEAAVRRDGRYDYLHCRITKLSCTLHTCVTRIFLRRSALLNFAYEDYVQGGASEAEAGTHFVQWLHALHMTTGVHVKNRPSWCLRCYGRRGSATAGCSRKGCAHCCGCAPAVIVQCCRYQTCCIKHMDGLLSKPCAAGTTVGAGGPSAAKAAGPADLKMSGIHGMTHMTYTVYSPLKDANHAP